MPTVLAATFPHADHELTWQFVSLSLPFVLTVLGVGPWVSTRVSTCDASL